MATFRRMTSLACSLLLLICGCGTTRAFRPCEPTEFGRPDYERHRGQEVVVQLTGGRRVTGVLQEVNCEAGTLAVAPLTGGAPVMIQGREVEQVRLRVGSAAEALGGVVFVAMACGLFVGTFLYLFWSGGGF